MRESEVAIALLNETPDHGEHLREALLALGAPVVYEASVHALDRAALERSQASVVIVNLAAHGDPHIDGLDELIADARYRVVFNEADVTSGLSGWDQARWARHLAAKVFDVADIDPPRPVGAQAVPVPDAAAMSDARIPTAPDDAGLDTLSVSASAFDVFDADSQRASDETTIEPELPALERLSLTDLDDFAVSPDLPAPIPDDVELAPIEFDGASTEPLHADAFAIDESLLAALDEEAPPPRAEEPFDFDVATREAAEPLLAEAAAVPATDGPAALSAPLDWSLVDLIDAEAQAAPTGPANFGIETLSAEEFLAPAESQDAGAPAMAAPESGLTFELIPLEEAVAPSAIESEPHESWLDPDAVVVPARVRRVWVLGASIGGPESVREFLAAFPRDYPALFLLAQHLGGEFVDLMTRQLAKATSMTVRTPTHGERVGHGEVVVVPATHRLQVDAEGVVTLERLAAQGEFSPSIDQVLRDVADRFGDAAGAIVFSGMSTDAVEGCRYLAEKGGRVYAQDPATCVVSAMVDGVRETGVVGFTGSPAELAAQLLAESKKGN